MNARLGRCELHASQHAEHAANCEEHKCRRHEAYADDGMVDRRETLQRRACGPDLRELAVQSHRRAAISVSLRSWYSLRWFPGCIGFSDRGREFRCRMYDDVEPHPAVAVTAEFVAKPLVTARHISLNAQEVRVSRHSVDLAGKPWIQKAWMTSRLVTTTSTGTPAGRCSTPSVLKAPFRGSGTSRSIAVPPPRSAAARRWVAAESRSPAINA